MQPPCRIQCCKGGFSVKVHDVILGDEKVGKVMLTQQGLYYLLECVCRCATGEGYRLQMRCGNDTHDFGVCVAIREGIGLKTRVKRNLLESKIPEFILISKKTKKKTLLVSVESRKPFQMVHCLTEGKLVKTEKGSAIVFPVTEESPAPALQDNDPIQESPNK